MYEIRSANQDADPVERDLGKMRGWVRSDPTDPKTLRIYNDEGKSPGVYAKGDPVMFYANDDYHLVFVFSPGTVVGEAVRSLPSKAGTPLVVVVDSEKSFTFRLLAISTLMGDPTTWPTPQDVSDPGPDAVPNPPPTIRIPPD